MNGWISRSDPSSLPRSAAPPPWRTTRTPSPRTSSGSAWAADCPTFAVVLIRDGVGAGVVVRRERLCVPFEFGHFQVWPRGRACDCGMRGCIESQLGSRAMPACRQGAHRAGAGRSGGRHSARRRRHRPGLRGDRRLPQGRASHWPGASPPCSPRSGRARSSSTPPRTSSPAVRAAARPTPSCARCGTSPTTPFRSARNCHIVTKPLDVVRGAQGAALIALENCLGIQLQPR